MTGHYWEHVYSFPQIRASMRPAGFAAGNRLPVRVARTSVSQASMRPAGFAAGNVLDYAIGAVSLSCFNEAGGFRRR